MSAQGFDFGVSDGSFIEPDADVDEAADPDSDRDRYDQRERPLSIAKDDAFHILQNGRRRAVLRYLLARQDRNRFIMRDITEAIAAWEHDTTVETLTSTERQRIYISLYQSHLPKLDEYGFVEYDQSRGVLKPRPLIAALEPFLENGLNVDRTLPDDNDRSDETWSYDRLIDMMTSFFH